MLNTTTGLCNDDATLEERVQLAWLTGGAFYDALALRADDLAGLLECFAQPSSEADGVVVCSPDNADALELEWKSCMCKLAERTFAVLSQPTKFAEAERQVHVSSSIPLLYRAGVYELMPDAPGSLKDMFALVRHLMLDNVSIAVAVMVSLCVATSIVSHTWHMLDTVLACEQRLLNVISFEFV
jgi:hypothetical protein